MIGTVCVAACPANSYTDLVINGGAAESRSDNFRQLDYTQHLRFTSNAERHFLNVSESISALPTDFTFSFWAHMTPDGASPTSTTTYDILNAFDRVKFEALSAAANDH